MALDDENNSYGLVGEEKRTGYFHEGKEIIAGRKKGRPPSYIRNPKFYPQETKVDAATLYAVYGDIKQVSELANVPESVIRGWKQEPWWIELQKQVYIEQNEKLAARISSVLDKTITHLEDRLEHGDEVLNQRTGEVVTKKVDASVLAKMFENMAHQRRITRGEPTSISAKIGVDDRLRNLEQAFIRFSQARTITEDEVEELTNAKSGTCPSEDTEFEDVRSSEDDE